VPSPASNAKHVLARDGWRKRAGDFYTRTLAPGVLGLLALAPNRGLPHQWRLQPYVGVVHEQINAVARALTASEGRNPFPQDTIRHQLVTLLDGPDAYERDRWLIAAEALDGNDRVFREIADAGRDVGIPWMEQRTGLDAIIAELRRGNAPWRRTPSLTAALWMKGEVAAAEAWLEQIASQFGAPPPALPEPLRGARVTAIGSSAAPEGWPRPHFEAFAARLRAGMAQHPDGPPAGWRPEPG
jgi:hypothetical protein